VNVISGSTALPQFYHKLKLEINNTLAFFYADVLTLKVCLYDSKRSMLTFHLLFQSAHNLHTILLLKIFTMVKNAIYILPFQLHIYYSSNIYCTFLDSEIPHGNFSAYSYHNLMTGKYT
jgi:hypothetical protein